MSTYYVVYDWCDQDGWETRGITEDFPTLAAANEAIKYLKASPYADRIDLVSSDEEEWVD